MRRTAALAFAVVAAVAAPAPAHAASRLVYRGTVGDGSAIRFVVGADRHVRGLDTASLHMLCTDGSDRRAHVFVDDPGRGGIAVDARGRWHGSFALHNEGSPAPPR